MPKKAVDAK